MRLLGKVGDLFMNRRGRQCTVFPGAWWASLCILSAVSLFSLTAVSASAQSTTGTTASSNDEGYTKKIREYTTESFFSTNLVDHLPASSTVPTPEKILGHIVGAPDVLTYSKDIYGYYDELAKASPRVKVFRVGKSEEGRDFLLVAVSDEANIAQLDHLKEITASSPIRARSRTPKRNSSFPRANRSTGLPGRFTHRNPARLKCSWN